MVYLDTNALVRFFTRDGVRKAQKVKQLLSSEVDIRIEDVVFPELEYVLTGLYRVTRHELCKIFQFLASQQNIKLDQSVKYAVSIYERNNLDMADSLIVAGSMDGKLASFDKKLLKTHGVKSYW